MYKRIRGCARPGCPNLVTSPAIYCKRHEPPKRRPFQTLPKKSPELHKFYQSHAWHKKSLRFRADNPMCETCRARGIITPATLVHHIPEVSDILLMGENPLDNQWLHSSCHPCHVRELQKRSNKKR